MKAKNITHFQPSLQTNDDSKQLQLKKETKNEHCIQIDCIIFWNMAFGNPLPRPAIREYAVSPKK